MHPEDDGQLLDPFAIPSSVWETTFNKRASVWNQSISKFPGRISGIARLVKQTSLSTPFQQRKISSKTKAALSSGKSVHPGHEPHVVPYFFRGPSHSLYAYPPIPSSATFCIRLFSSIPCARVSSGVVPAPCSPVDLSPTLAAALQKKIEFFLLGRSFIRFCFFSSFSLVAST